MASSSGRLENHGHRLGARFPALLRWSDRILRPVEFLLKKPVFGCHMCGQCVLHSNGLTCPMECPKNLRNGPCGGVGLDGSCEVDRKRKCRWYLAVDRADRLPVWQDHIARQNPAVDWSLQGSSAVVNYLTGRDNHQRSYPAWRDAAMSPRDEKPVRADSKFERMLRAGEFVVASDLGPPASVDVNRFLEEMRQLVGIVDLTFMGDSGGANPDMCGLVAALLAQQVGLEAVLHVTCRDRNRIALQNDAVGAYVMGIRNLLLLSGDHPRIGDNPQAKPVYDLDSVTLIEMVHKMRTRHTYDNDRPMDAAPRFFIGGAVSPTAPPFDYRLDRLAKKILAGADFVASQQIFDMDMLARYMARVHDAGLDEKVHILIGVGALSGPEIARWTGQNIPGIVMPEATIRRLEKTPPSHRRKEGLRICVEQIQRLREMPGVSGVLLMTNDLPGEPDPWMPLPELVELAGLKRAPVLA